MGNATRRRTTSDAGIRALPDKRTGDNCMSHCRTVTHKHPCDEVSHHALAASSRETGRLHPAVALAHQLRSQENENVQSA